MFYTCLKLLSTFEGAFQEIFYARAGFNKIPENYTSLLSQWIVDSENDNYFSIFCLEKSARKTSNAKRTVLLHCGITSLRVSENIKTNRSISLTS